MRKRIAARVVVILAVGALAGCWLKEATQRRAVDAADYFMGPTLGYLGRDWVRFHPAHDDHNGNTILPHWCVTYSARHVFSEHLDVCVDLRGNVRTANWKLYADLIDLPLREQLDKKLELCRMAVDRIIEEDKEQNEVRSEQHGGQISSEGAPSAPPNESSP